MREKLLKLLNDDIAFLIAENDFWILSIGAISYNAANFEEVHDGKQNDANGSFSSGNKSNGSANSEKVEDNIIKDFYTDSKDELVDLGEK